MTYLTRGVLSRYLGLVLIFVLSVAASAPAAPAEVARAAGLSPYRGLGSWVDIYDSAEFDNPVATVKAMKEKGVRTLFLETGNYSRGPIYRPAAQATFIHAAHRRNMKVVAWYLPGFTDPEADFNRSMASINFKTGRGQSFDGFGLDIEATLEDDVSRRIQRMLALSRRLRSAAGDSYSLGAIVPSPHGMRRVPDYWGPVRDFPWTELARIYDAIVPMSYFSWQVDGLRDVYEYNAFNVRLIREESGDAEVPVHLIGGIAGETTQREIEGYVRAVRTFGTPGGSLYAFDSTGPRHWAELKKIPVNPAQSPALPISLRKSAWDAALGNVPDGDRSHPKEVFFQVGARSEPLLLAFEAFDIASGEVDVQVNWRSVGKVQVTPERGWGNTQTIRIPQWRLHDDRSNTISFIARGQHPDWNVWGVRNIDARNT